ncbi:transposase [Hymenobacter caeli]|uniref:transposase n=1 Tax=Hymenobacter caeli TaxID=2735894 RepID=UPI00156F33AD
MNKARSLLTELTDGQWARLPRLPGPERSPGPAARNTRLFVEAVPWRARCGVSGRVRPAAQFGPWHALYARFRRWRQAGRRHWPTRKTTRKTTRKGQPACAGCRPGPRPGAPQVAAGANQKTARAGRRGGFTAKLCLGGAARGRICALALTGGQARDCPQAPGRLRGHLRPGQAVPAGPTTRATCGPTSGRPAPRPSFPARKPAPCPRPTTPNSARSATASNAPSTA